MYIYVSIFVRFEDSGDNGESNGKENGKLHGTGVVYGLRGLIGITTHIMVLGSLYVH